MIEVGRLCVKIAGRDAGKKCVVVEVIDDNYVLVDGETRRRKSNILHLEPLNQVLDIRKGASHETVIKAFEQLGLQVMKTKPKKAGARPRRARKSKLAGPATKPAAKPAAKTAPAEKKPAVKKAPEKKVAKPKVEKKA